MTFGMRLLSGNEYYWTRLTGHEDGQNESQAERLDERTARADQVSC